MNADMTSNVTKFRFDVIHSYFNKINKIELGINFCTIYLFYIDQY